VTRRFQSDDIDWDRGRDGYIDLHRTPTYAPVPKTNTPSPQRYGFSIATQERIASLIAAGGTIWAAYTATVDYTNLWRLQLAPPGPLEICALGILLWLHAKWRRSTKIG
jgi:hypothetical protein